MKKNLLQRTLLLALMTMSAGVAGVWADTAQGTIVGDAHTRNGGNAGKTYNDKVIELNKGGFWGFIKLELPTMPENTKVTKATLRLVSERRKGGHTYSFYAYGNDWDETTVTYSSQQTAIEAATAEGIDPVAEVSLGSYNKAVTDGGASTNIDDWAFTVDLTAYVKTISTQQFSLLVMQTVGGTANKFYTKEAEDAASFTADQLRPVFTVEYEEDLDMMRSVTMPVADATCRNNNTNYGTATTMEIKNNTDFVGLMRFEIPAEALTDEYEIESATLRLVTERVKDNNNRGMLVYGYDGDFNESSATGDKSADISAGVAAGTIATFEAAGLYNKALEANDAITEEYADVAKWTNYIDLTAYVKSRTSNVFSIIIAGTPDINKTRKFFTKERTEDLTKTVNGTDYTFKAEDLVPQLTVIYKKKDGTTTGIKETLRQTDENAIYDLQGRRVSKHAKGLYIKGGKKLFIR